MEMYYKRRLVYTYFLPWTIKKVNIISFSLKESKMSSPSKSICFILFNGELYSPQVSILYDSILKKMKISQYQPGFWLFSLIDIDEDDSFHLFVSLRNGPSKSFFFEVKNISNFVLLDVSQKGTLMSFNDFNLFFMNAISNNKINFSFDDYQSIDKFINVFDDRYLLWSLLFISAQPWMYLFKYNPEISSIITKHINRFILNYFFQNKNEITDVDFKQNESFHEDDFKQALHTPKKHICTSEIFESGLLYFSTFLSFIQVQLGRGYAYIVSLILYNKNPQDSVIPPLSYSEHVNSDSILELLLKNAKNLYHYELVFFAYLAISTPSSTFKMNILDYTKSDIRYNEEKGLEILCFRLIVSKNISVDDLKYIVSLFPFINKVKENLTYGNYFIPFEWINALKDVLYFETEIPFILLARSSLKKSIPKHYKNCFADITESGALTWDHIDLSNHILQPGCILQNDVNYGDSTMMMSGSVALSGSTLSPNSSIPRNAVILPLTKEKIIDPTVKLIFPVQIKNGVTIGKNTIVSKNVTIGVGTRVGSDVFIGNNVAIYKGCIINDNEIVPNNLTLPTGFNYRQSTIEFAKIIPDVIYVKDLMFYKQENGFIDLEMIINACDSLILEYFKQFKDYPCECARQFAMNIHKIDLHAFEELDESLIKIFQVHSLLFFIEFWNYVNQHNETPEIPSTLENSLLNLLYKAIKQLDSFTFEDLYDERNASFLLTVVQNISLFSNKGLKEEQITSLKNFLFELADEAFVRLSLLRISNESKTPQILQQIIDLSRVAIRW